MFSAHHRSFPYGYHDLKASFNGIIRHLKRMKINTDNLKLDEEINAGTIGS
jgi:hypothetical protein